MAMLVPAREKHGDPYPGTPPLHVAVTIDEGTAEASNGNPRVPASVQVELRSERQVHIALVDPADAEALASVLQCYARSARRLNRTGRRADR